MATSPKRARQESESNLSETRSSSGNSNSNVDYFSSLSDDCLLEVLARLDHNDLDEMEQLSKRMCKLSELSRPKAVKVEAAELYLLEGSEYKVEIEGAEYIFNQSNELFRVASAIDRKRFHLYTWDRPKPCSSSIPVPVSSILNRFAFERCTFTSFIVDSNFLDLLERLDFTAIDMTHSFFDQNLNVNDRNRFFSILIAAKPRTIALHFPDDKIGRLPILKANFSREIVLSLSESSVESLSKFGSILSANIEIDTKWMVSALKRRLREKAKGSWGILITRDFTQEDIEADLELDLKYTSEVNDWHQIEIIGTRHKVVFQRNNVTPWPFIALFQGGNDEET
ncbi:hypothetical protein PMAYCL1PPCAC_25347 [Pristionchus mayeri]|uniref:F-box domain-containing protein n=1 Tax=Pristionchus mayeri TaxID=1317129 RepID=A0AAN5I799_9BILA|nr:hypothetical protein PMAYCL1PPCAC_25347 [Pristionchus mayeri]